MPWLQKAVQRCTSGYPTASHNYIRDKMKFWIRLLLLTLFDFAVIWFWVRQQDPDPSVSIGIIILVPLVVAVNLIIAGLLFATKRPYAKLFVANSFICGALMYILFTQGISRHQRQRYESWTFPLNDTTFRVNYHKPDSTFFISYSTNPGSSSIYIYGHVQVVGRQYTLSTDTLTLTIKNEHLYGFRNDTNSIKLEKLAL